MVRHFMVLAAGFVLARIPVASAAEATHEAVDPHADPIAAHDAAVEGAHGAADASGVVDPHAAADAAHGGGGVGLPQFDPSSFSSQVFWLAIAFAILYIVFSKKTLPEIGAVLKKREGHIRSTLEAAKRQKEVAEGLQAEYERDIENARADATSAFTEAEKSIKAKSDAQYRAFQERAAKEIEATEKDIAKAKALAMEDMQHLAAEIAAQAAEKIIGVESDINEAKTVVKSLKAKAA
jgi:F-type H+-transporting ATPase subunit b